MGRNLGSGWAPQASCGRTKGEKGKHIIPQKKGGGSIHYVRASQIAANGQKPVRRLIGPPVKSIRQAAMRDRAFQEKAPWLCYLSPPK